MSVPNPMSVPRPMSVGTRFSILVILSTDSLFSRPRLRWAYCAVLSSLVKFHRALPSVGTVCRPFGRHDLKLGKDSQCIICVQWWARPGHDSPGVARNAEQSKLYLRSAMDLKYICMKLFLRFASTINISQLWSRTQKSGI